MATFVRLVCRPEGGVVEAVDTDGLRYVWMEGVEVVEQALAAWAERETVDGYTVAYDEGRGSFLGFDAECPVQPEGVALVELYTPAGARVQGVAFNKSEFPGGEAVFANYVVAGSTSLGGLSQWWEARKRDAQAVADAAAGAARSAAEAVAGAVNAGRDAVGGALVSVGDAVATLPDPKDALNSVAEGLGDAAGRVTAAFGVAAARGGASAVGAFWDELPVGGKVVAALAMVALVVVVARKVSG